ncbi:hypothetical protein K504DRAFT_421752 [Pleomassaria siparia CBS 279.74]|uniref:Uncharacterized protein n=1 Tax=Pleomassaria siparia CBS 279.74 TaxID=1314801 RepID=A0A6G1KRG0_9PLEO|nr:hypothetical protein K504DRAFT_421752 [Pleomassaria siparia CBS 279.74]
MPPSPPAPPPGASFPIIMSGNFDFPQASSVSPPPPAARLANPSTSTSSTTRSQRLQNLSRRQQALAALPAPAPAPDREDTTIISPMAPRHPRVDSARRRQIRRPIPTEREVRDASAGLSPRRLPPSSILNRPRATPSERYLRRSHARLRDMSELDLTPDLLDSLSDTPLVNPFTVTNSTRPRSPTADLDSPRRQTKRRKLDHEAPNPPAYNGFKYGYRGQVVSGRLRMEIVSCDGGEYDKYNSSGLYKIQNVLKNDKSVYCSERSRCNLLLKHIGEAPFALEKVVIRAPDRGFTAPIQEGLVFVSMSPDELLAGTADYKIEYSSSPRSSPAPSSLGDQQISLQEAIDDPYVWENPRQERVERIDRARERAPANSDRRYEAHTGTGHPDDIGENCDYPPTDDQPYPSARRISAPTPPPFTITTESDPESDELDEVPSAAIMADRLRRESRWRPDSDEDEDELVYRFPPPRRSYALDSLENFGERRWRERLDPIRAARLHGPSRIEPTTDKASESEGLIAPHARFFIAKHKNKITIKFHPAVSGKYVLLKLWSPTHDGNIDIESVQFHGFSGPRFFPAVQPR